MSGDPWFKEWFNTEYYHLLYDKRNDAEALAFIERLIQTLMIPQGAKVADIACGRGRHSRVLAELGFVVHGYDLSANSIQYAAGLKTPNTTFSVHDIRETYLEQGFTAAFNLFTSFGYFDDPREDAQCLENIYNILEPEGYFIQDYLNGAAFVKLMPASGEEIRGNVLFSYEKSWQQPFIVKNIQVNDNGEIHDYIEKVKVYNLQELENLHKNAGFNNLGVYGDYQMNPFISESSPRIIIVSQKPNV